MQLKAFSAQGIRSIAISNAEVSLGRPTILTGANDGGKTAMLFAVGFLLGGPAPTTEDLTHAREDDDPEGGIVDGRFAEAMVVGRFELTAEEQAELNLPREITLRRRVGAARPGTYELLDKVPESEHLRGLGEHLRLEDLRARAAAAGVDVTGRANVKASYLEPLRAAAERVPKVEAWSIAPGRIIEKLPAFLAFSSTEAPDPESDIRSSLGEVYRRLLEDQDLIGPVRKVEDEIRHRLEQDAERLCKHIEVRCPEFRDIDVRTEVSFRSGFQGVTLVTARGDDAGVGIRSIGAGSRRRITLAVWEWTARLLEEDVGSTRSLVLAYDEPDTHLDYGHQRELVDLIRAQASKPGVQVIVATHSLNLIDKVDISDVAHLTLEDGRTVVHRLAGDQHADIDEHLAQISAAMGLRNSVLLHERCFVAVEGATEMGALPILFRASTGMSLQAAGIALIGANGNDGALRVARFLNDHGRRIAFIVDADSATDRGRRKVFRPEALRAQGIREDQLHLVGNPNEIEELFDDAIWAAVAQDVWPRDNGEAWRPEDFAALRAGGRFSDDLLKAIRGASERAPGSKPALLIEAARRLHTPEDVPHALRDVFEALVRMADGT